MKKTPEWEELAAQVLQITYACPFDQRNPTFCPLFKIRSESLQARMKWVKGLKLAELKAMVKRHELCLQMKERRTEL
jgi:hypothetical protein